MKLPPFNYEKMEWDAWRAFHVDHGYNKFVQFDTGEFVVCNRRWSPEHRGIYDDLHIQIVATDDELCPALYVPGSDKPIPKSHLNHKGQQTLLLDLDSKRAVSLDLWLTEKTVPSVPTRFTSRRVSVWYAGPDAVPYGGPVMRHYPQPLTFDERKHIKELEDACKVWLQMQADPVALRREHHMVKALPVIEFVDVSFGVLTLAHRTAIATNGFNMLVQEEHPWLTFNAE